VELEIGVQVVWEKSSDKQLEGGKKRVTHPVVEKPEGKRLSRIW